VDWRTYDHYAYAAMAVLGTALAVVVLNWLMVSSPYVAWVVGLKGVASPFTNVVGVLFGLTVAFLSNDTWTAHDRARSSVLREADALRSLDILASGLEGATRARLKGAIASYAAASAGEWHALSRCEAEPAAQNAADRLLGLVAAPELADVLGAMVQQLMLREVTAIREHRDLRIGLSRTHVNPLKWLGMAFLGFLTLLSVAVVHIDNPRAALTAMILFGLAAAPTAAIVLIHGNPFQPPSAVSPAPISEALAARPD
jgi:hypothetical protein